MITDEAVRKEMEDRGFNLNIADPLFHGIDEAWDAIKAEMIREEEIFVTDRIMALLSTTGMEKADRVAPAEKIYSGWCSEDPCYSDYELGTHVFELYYNDYTIKYSGSWWFDDDTKNVTFSDHDLMSGLLTTDKLRSQGL